MPSYRKLYRSTNNIILNSKGGRELQADAKRLKMCLRKTGFDTQFEGEIMAAKRGLRAYKCDYCPHWHLTSHL